MLVRGNGFFGKKRRAETGLLSSILERWEPFYIAIDVDGIHFFAEHNTSDCWGTISFDSIISCDVVHAEGTKLRTISPSNGNKNTILSSLPKLPVIQGQKSPLLMEGQNRLFPKDGIHESNPNPYKQSVSKLSGYSYDGGSKSGTELGNSRTLKTGSSLTSLHDKNSDSNQSVLELVIHDKDVVVLR